MGVAMPAFLYTPAIGVVTFFFIGENPSWSASYPCVAVVRTPTTGHGPSSTTVTGIMFPLSPKTWVIPTFRPISPSFIAMAVVSLELDLDVHAAGQLQLHQRVHRLRRRVEDVEQAFVSAHLELLPRRLVHVRGAEHRPPVDDGGQQDRTRDSGAGPANGLHDLLHGPVEEMVVVRLQTDADLLVGGECDHIPTPRSPPPRRPPPSAPPPGSRTATPSPSRSAGSTRSPYPTSSPPPPPPAPRTPPSRPSSGSRTAAGTPGRTACAPPPRPSSTRRSPP